MTNFDPVTPVADSVCLGHRLAHPTPRVHRRVRILHRRVGSAKTRDWTRCLRTDLDLLDENLFDRIWNGRRDRNCHALPVRNQLEPVHGGRGSKCVVAVVRVRKV